MFHQDIQTLRREFDEIRGVWIADETLSRVFDISSQSKQKLRSKRRTSSKSMPIKTVFSSCTILWQRINKGDFVCIYFIPLGITILCFVGIRKVNPTYYC